MHCPQCGEVGEGRYCAHCGSEIDAPPRAESEDRFWQEEPAGPAPAADPASRRRVWPIAVLLAAALIVVGGTGLWFLTTPDDRVEAQRTSGNSASTSSDEQTTSSESEETTDPTTTTTTTTSSSSTTSASPEEELSGIRSDSVDAARMGDQWAVTLSAKYDGISDSQQTTESGSHTFREADILALHDQLEERHESDGAVYLLTSKDLASTADGDYPDTLWMTMLDPGGLSSRDAAVRWCKREFPELSGDSLENRCYPRKLESP